MSNLANKLYFKALEVRDNFLKALKNEKGETNLIAIILILAIVIVLVIMFKDELTEIVEDIWESIGGDVDDALGNGSQPE